MRRLPPLLIAFLIIPASLYSASQETDPEEIHSIDRFREKCTNDNPSTVGMNVCTDEAYKMWDVEMNKNYKLLMSVLNKQEKKQLKDAQIAWINYRDKEEYFRTRTLTSEQGTLYPLMARGERMGIVKQRALELKQFYETLKLAGRI